MKTKMLMAVLMAACSWGQAATVSDVTARQRWPWNGMVDIDYTITGEDTTGMTVDLSVKDNNTGIIYTPTNLLQIPPSVEGRHRVTWDTAADNLNLISSNMTVTVSLGNFTTVDMTNALYYVIDLSGGPDAPHWPVSTLNYIPNGGWTEEYKTSKLVLRRIEKGKISGINKNIEGAFTSIAIDKPYYIGVFEVTSAQFKLMTGGTGFYNSQYVINYITDDARPQYHLSYYNLRGDRKGRLYPQSTIVDTNSVIGILRAKTGLATLDLPTEAQWEYACRAGTTGDFNNSAELDARVNYELSALVSTNVIDVLGRYTGNQEDGRGGFNGSMTTVGSYLPNQWGLYDMHGNVIEWCLDWSKAESQRALRGGSCSSSALGCRSGYRSGNGPSNGSNGYGFRLCCSAGL